MPGSWLVLSFNDNDDEKVIEKPARLRHSAGWHPFFLLFSVAITIAVVISLPGGRVINPVTGSRYIPPTPTPTPTLSATASAAHPFNSAGWLRITEAHNGPVSVVSWIPGSLPSFYSAGVDGQIKCWYMLNGEVRLLTQPDRLSKSVTALAVTPNLDTLAVALSDYSITLNTKGDSFPPKLNFHTNTVTNLAFSPDSKLLASASRDTTAHLTTAKGQSVATLAGHSDRVNSVAWSPDSKLLATASSDNTIKIWNSAGALQTTLTAHTQAVNSVAWSADGKFLVSGSSDGTVRLWQTGTWQTIKTLTDHQSPVRAVVWQPGTTMFASGGDDNKVRLWNSQGQPVAVLDGSYEGLTSLSWSADGDYLAAGTNDGSLWLWKTDQYRP